MRTRTVGTPGGAKLRALREGARRTQLWVEIEAGLGTGYLQRLESGRVVQPEHATLERILTALEARYSERREVLELFGYMVVTPLPSEEEIAWACAVCQRELHEVPFPAYVLDCTHRLLLWNHSVSRLFGKAPDDPTLGGLARQSLLAAWFDTGSPLAPLVAEPDTFLPAIIRALRYEMQQFRTETWHTEGTRVAARAASLPSLLGSGGARASPGECGTSARLRAAHDTRRWPPAIPAVVRTLCARCAFPSGVLFPSRPRHHAPVCRVGRQPCR